MTSIIPLIGLLFYVLPILFIIWFILKYLQIQNERNEVLKNISKTVEQIAEKRKQK